MDFWSRLVGGSHAPKKPVPKPQSNDPRARLDRFQRVYRSVTDLCHRARAPAVEASVLDRLQASLQRLATLIREETRASVPHTCLQFAADNQIYIEVARAATISNNELVVVAAVAVLAALVESEEEDLLASEPFAKSLMSMVTRVINGGRIIVGIDTETTILELLFTIAAKIRLQPEILSIWFRSTVRPELEDVFVKEKKSFVGITQKDDFPLCYLLIDRVHHEGRIGDFARTGLLYIFEATGRSEDLEEWVISSDLPTLMASGLGALYSQLSRELSILHPDATLPAVLAMSDYSTAQPRANAESAFSLNHQSHMTTFLSYLAFWQDVLDHCRSADVKQTLLDHFQILFLQQLLYPSLLQSSDTDAGSSVAVLTYMNAMLEALEYPDLIHMMLTYLLAIQEEPSTIPSAPTTPVRPSMPPRSPTTLKRRQSLMLLTAPKDSVEAVEPSVFNLVDLTLNGVSSLSSQTAFAALQLIATTMRRQKQYAFGTMLKVHKARPGGLSRTIGAQEVEVGMYIRLASLLHRNNSLDEAYTVLCEDVRNNIEAQVPLVRLASLSAYLEDGDAKEKIAMYYLDKSEPLLRSINDLLKTFFTNNIDVNLALTQALISVFSCPELSLDGWIAVEPSKYKDPETQDRARQAWQEHLDEEETETWSAIHEASRRPSWDPKNAPIFFSTMNSLTHELESVREAIPNLDQLLSSRKTMLQASGPEMTVDDPLFPASNPVEMSSPAASAVLRGHTRSSSTSSANRARSGKKTIDKGSSHHRHSSSVSSQSQVPASATDVLHSSKGSIYQPPPPETLSTTDSLMQKIEFPCSPGDHAAAATSSTVRTSSLNHVLTNIVVLQEFILELAAVLQIRAAVLGDQEVRYA